MYAKKNIFNLLLFIALLNTFYTQINTSPVLSTYKIRPQSLNGPRKVAGEVPGENTHVFIPDKPEQGEWPLYDRLLLGTLPSCLGNKKDLHGFFSVTPSYQSSFNASALTRSLFGSDLICQNQCQSIKIQGSAVDNRDPRAWLANNFYLPTDFQSILTFEPTISNALIDFNAYIGLDRWVSGMYGRIYAPFVHTKWDLHMKEKVLTPTTPDERGILPNATAFFAGSTPPVKTVLYGPTSNRTQTPLIRNPLMASKMSGNNCSNHKTINGFGEIRAELGWDFIHNYDYHLGVYLTGAAPTGTTPDAAFLYAPMVGNRKHGELGAGITGHWQWWKSEHEWHHCGIYLDAQVTHIFTAQEQRAFDLKGINGPLSRYMLAAKMNDKATNQLTGEDNFTEVAVPYQFANEYTPVANLTTQKVGVSIGAQADATAWFNYTADAFSCDIGYNFWMQTREQIHCSSSCGPRLRTEKNTWVLNGDAIFFGTGRSDKRTYPLSFSESKATIHAGTNQQFKNTSASDLPFRYDPLTNPGVDNALPDAFNIPPVLGVQGLDTLAFLPETSIGMWITDEPLFLSEEHIALTPNGSTLSHTFFANVGYTWECGRIAPYISVGGQAEFGSSDTTCSRSCALSQWGVWAKIGAICH
ncbi:MAG: hypothetical protein NT124_01825 [Candidatus Dependentiae bacterium]|nr:hypothetical protein [Candidatus Dependentiae bacterium]